jgi:hypothetical protein
MMHRTTGMLSLRYLRIPPDMYERLCSMKRSSRHKYAVTYVHLHCDLLRDYDFGFLDDVSKGHYLCLCLLAVQLDNRLPWDAGYLAMQVGAHQPIDLALLINAGFLEPVYRDSKTGEILPLEIGAAPPPPLTANTPADFANSSGDFSQFSTAANAAENTANFAKKNAVNLSANSDTDLPTKNAAEISEGKGKGREVNKREKNALPDDAKPRRRGRPRRTAALPEPHSNGVSSPNPIPSELSKKNQVEHVVQFIKEQIQSGNLKIETLTQRAFHHLSNEEWEEVQRRLKS